MSSQKVPFDWQDPLRLDDLLTDEERMIARHTRALLDAG